MFINPKPSVDPPDHECEYSKSWLDAYYDNYQEYAEFVESQRNHVIN
ncbi:hypothetical protein M0Q97_09375 [Candidatus Dojkabacteria bacterium]|jgi:hypothetical protein|nr:hypothetical protein [Candidatus Dojkabacteria bacterium]